MSTEQPTEQDHRRRIALRTLCNLAEQHNLPMPADINLHDVDPYPVPGISLRLDKGQRDGVHAWAAVLDLPVLDDDTLTTDGKDWVRVKADRWNYQEPVWLHFSHVEVWCSNDAASGDPR